jgi:hypothetical protein|tara:strand:+ start:675 stop:923 length:249 start_codon:yes stop_codon:yes gene_type:complete
MDQYENEMGLPKVYEDDIVMIFLIDDDEDSDEEETESMDKCECKDKVEIKKKPHYSQGGISQFSMPPLNDKIKDIILSVIGG